MTNPLRTALHAFAVLCVFLAGYLCAALEGDDPLWQLLLGGWFFAASFSVALRLAEPR